MDNGMRHGDLVDEIFTEAPEENSQGKLADVIFSSSW